MTGSFASLKGRGAGLRACSVLIVAALAACAGDRVVVGSKNFTEQDILGELVAQQIERETGLAVERRFHLGGTFVCHQALTGGEIDVYVEYTGTALTAILELAPWGDPDAVYDTVSRIYADRFGLVWGEPLGFNNTFAILVRDETASRLGLETISDAAPHTENWTAGFGYEFMQREDGFPGLAETYGLDFEKPPRTMELGLTYRALAEGRVDLIAGNSTDGLIQALDLYQLEDDRDYFPPYYAAPVMRREMVQTHPEVKTALDRLGGTIDEREMRRLNYLVDVEHRSPHEVVREWLDRATDPPAKTPARSPGS